MRSSRRLRTAGVPRRVSCAQRQRRKGSRIDGDGRSGEVRPARIFSIGVVVMAGLGALLLAGQARLGAQPGGVSIGPADLGGVVTSANGPEAGVWVIAETLDLPTKLARIVVTDEQGRYLMPDLPIAGYRVWVRGYGLVDSAPVQSTPGRTLDLRAVVAPSSAAAAEYYPAIYWYAMLKV